MNNKLAKLPVLVRTVLPQHLGCKGIEGEEQPEATELREACVQMFDEVLDWVTDAAEREPAPTFREFETGLRERILRLGALMVVLFLALVEQRVSELGDKLKLRGRTYTRRREPKARNLMTWFGVVRYWRTYFFARPSFDHPGRGVHPTDMTLGLGRSRISLELLALGANLSARMPFEQARESMLRSVGVAPSIEVLERGVLGLGALSDEFFRQLGPPKGDGDVLVVQLDGKGFPTATEQELARRRGKRKHNPHPGSKRHRNRNRRKRWRKKPRHPEPGTEHAKNAKVATVMVAYTLRRAADGTLEGPLNKRVWASTQPKREMVELARFEAQRRGFDPDSPDVRIQILTDGDPDLESYIIELFPHAIRSIDIMHVLEYIWQAARELWTDHQQRVAWVRKQERRLLRSQVHLVIRDLEQESSKLAAKRGVAAQRRKAVDDALRYISKRLDWLDYAALLEDDLEIATGAVEGAVKHVVGARFDQGGMRWIHQRAEPLLKLRCIVVNGDWDAFIRHVERRQHHDARRGDVVQLLRNTPAPILTLVPEAA